MQGRLILISYLVAHTPSPGADAPIAGTPHAVVSAASADEWERRARASCRSCRSAGSAGCTCTVGAKIAGWSSGASAARAAPCARRVDGTPLKSDSELFRGRTPPVRPGGFGAGGVRRVKRVRVPAPSRPAGRRCARCRPTGAPCSRSRRPWPALRRRAGGAWSRPGAWPATWRRRCSRGA